MPKINIFANNPRQDLRRHFATVYSMITRQNYGAYCAKKI